MAENERAVANRDEAIAAPRTFDPRPHLRTITSNGQHTEYLDVKWRLAWLRTDHPEAQITTEHVVLTEDSAVFRAMVWVPDGGCATGYGSETRDDWPDFIETAETKAIGRALAALGYGTQFALDFDADIDPNRPRFVDSPAEASETLLESRPSGGDRPERGRSASFQAAPGSRQEWDEFWRWARSLGYQNRQHLEEVFEHSLEGMTPDQVRDELLDYRGRDEGATASE